MKNKLFPQPVELPGMRSRWRLSDVEKYEYGSTDITRETEKYLSANQLAERYGVSRVSIWKQARDSRVDNQNAEVSA